MRIGITEMPESGYTLQNIVGTKDMLIQLYRDPEEAVDNEGNKHITANVLVLTRRNFENLAQSVEANFDWYWQEAEKEQSKQLISQFTEIVQKWLDDAVRTRNYDNVQSAATYLNSSDPVFSAEARAVVDWRDKVWRQCYNIVNDVVGGKRAVPSCDEVISELPKLEW